MIERSPLAPTSFPALPAIDGVRLAAGNCGIRHEGRPDLLLMTFDQGTQVAGVLTKSLTRSAAVDWCRDALQNGHARALVVNSGNANAFTGAAGLDAVHQTVGRAAAVTGCVEQDVFVASTGVIGEPLSDEKIVAGIEQLNRSLTGDQWEPAAQAIRTTDTFAKGGSYAVPFGDRSVTINGIAKGSGMIAPDMATMLSFIATDAAIPAKILQDLLNAANDRTFNAITVDSDTSTSDTVLVFATGKVPMDPPPTRITDRRLKPFRRALELLMKDLAHQIVRDGEGATKFIEVTVTGAGSRRDAKRIALAIANSPLVKTAVAGEDANWGRIVMAIGKSGGRADRDRLRISIGDTVITENGQVLPDYDEAPVAAYMKGQEIRLAADVGIGKSSATVWTCDLTHGYISINADYRS